MTSHWSILEHILIALRRPRLGDPKEPTQWPSEGSAVYLNEYGEIEVAGACRRRTYFRLLLDTYAYNPKLIENVGLTGTAEHILAERTSANDHMRFIWAQGELYEQYIIDMAKNTGIFIGTQIPIYIPEFNVSGKLDLVAVDPETGLLHIVESKSVHGRGGEAVLGTAAQRSRGYLGIPKDSHLIQAGIYEWWFASKNENYGHTRLVCGDRGTGLFGEFLIKAEVDLDTPDDTNIYIYYFPVCEKGRWTKTNITINSILEEYKTNAEFILTGKIPERDFDIDYPAEKILKHYEQDRLTRKADIKQCQSYVERVEENTQRVAENKKPKVSIKLPKVSDFHCNYCDYAIGCYSLKT